MNLRQLEAFRATMRCGSITGAAKLLHISQPSVSRLVADLEASLGFNLFTRSGHGLVSTVEARKFQHSVESMFIGMDKLRETAEAIRTTKDETVSLGIISIFAYSIMPEAINELRADRPELHFEISVHNTPAIVDAVLLQRMDLGIICPSRRYEGIHFLFETRVPYVCLLPDSHPLAPVDEPVDLYELAAAEFVALDPGYLDQAIQDPDLVAIIRSNARIVSKSDPAISALSRVTGLPSIVDPFTARVAEALGGVTARPILQQLMYPVAIISRGTETLSLAAQSLAETLVRQLDDS